MRLYLVRHSDAVHVGERGVKTDAGRMLSERGREKCERLGVALARLECAPARIVSSPLTRAVETARLMGRHIANCEIELSDALLPGAEPHEIHELVSGSDAASVMLVGHMPHMADLASFLLGGNFGVDVLFKKGATCSLVFDGGVRDGYGCLEWLMQPGLIRRLT